MIPDKNSMLIWWPRVKDLGIPVPRTEILDCFCKRGSGGKFIADITAAGHRIGYPLFLRTDLASGKHGWDKTCYIPTPDVLIPHMYAVCEENDMAGFIGLNYQAIVLREFLPLHTAFKAFYGNMPINREFRLFVKDGEVICIHPYWPHDAIRGHTKSKGWNQKLTQLQELSSRDEMILRNNAELVSSAIPGYWSVDFAQHKDGLWFLLDMATGAESFHWAGCDKAI